MTSGTAKSDAGTRLPLPPGPPLAGPWHILIYPFRYRLVPLLRRRYGDMFTVWILGRPAVQLCTPELNRAVLSADATTFHAGEGNSFLSDVMGEHSVLTLDEDAHRRMRKLLMAPFHGRMMRGYRGMITELAATETASWRPGEAFAAHARMNALTLEVILRVVFGVTDGGRLEDLRRALRRFLAVPIWILLGVVVAPLRRLGPWKRLGHVLERIDTLLYAEIAARRSAPDLADRPDVLSQLMSVDDDGDRLTDAELRDQMVTLLLAGHETTATALAWTLHDLARDEALQRKVVAAVDGDDEAYLQAVVQESMRLHPVIYSVARTLTRDIELGGHRIPAGYTVMPGIGPVHADPANHTDPEVFRPERFLDGETTPATWLPFGGGVRRCLGAGFAQMEATVILRAIFARYTISAAAPEPEPTRPRHITLAPARGSRIVVRRR